MKIGIDIDDTLINTRDLQIKFWKDYYISHPKDGYNTNLPPTINDFGDKYVQEFWDIYRLPLNFESTVKDDVPIITKKLKEDNHTLCIVTSRPKEKYNDLHKLIEDWAQKNDITFDIIYTDVRNKGEFCKDNNIDILIDDDIKHINNAIKNNVKGILFNTDPDYNGLKTTSWRELYDIIKNIDNENKEQ